MSELRALLALVLIAALSPLTYVLLNIVAVHLVKRILSRVQIPLTRLFGPVARTLGAFATRQLSDVSPLRIRTLIGLQSAVFGLLFLLVNSTQHLLAVVAGLVAYVLFVCAVSVSLLASFPPVRRIAADPSWRLIAWAVPIAGIFVARGYGSAWVGEVISASPANAPSAMSQPPH